MTNQPTLAQFMNADFTIIAPDFIGGDPTITVENAVAVEPFCYEVDVDTWGRLFQEALCETEEAEYIERALETETDLSEQYGINL